MAYLNLVVSTVLILSLFWRSIAVDPSSESPESMLNFTLRFSREVIQKFETSLYSPLCVHMILSTIAQAAKRNSARQIDELLGLGSEDSQRYFSSISDYIQDEAFHWGNRMYVRNDLEINKDFQENIEKNFNMPVQKVNFNDVGFADNVNDWVSSITDETIREAVNSTYITPETSLLLVSAIFFADDWDTPFDPTETQADSFYVDEKTNVSLPFMTIHNRTTITGINKEKGFKWIRLGYKKSPTASITFILPTKRFSMKETLENIKAEDLCKVLNDNNTDMINIKIPKFNITFNTMLKSSLIRLGVADIFTNEADLSGMVDTDKPVKLQDISHNCRIDINEKGTSATSVSTANVNFLSGSVGLSEVPLFKADEPFFFILSDGRVQLPYFMGLLVNPQG